MSGSSIPVLLTEFHHHRLGTMIEGAQYRDADGAFFDDVVKGADARLAEIDGLIEAHLSAGWTLDRLDRPMRQILRCGVYELVARPDIPTATVINEYVDVAHAFYEKREAGFVNGLLDAIARKVRG